MDFSVISIVHMESVHVSAAHIKLFKGLAHKGGIFSHPLMCLGPSTDMMTVWKGFIKSWKSVKHYAYPNEWIIAANSMHVRWNSEFMAL